MERLNIRAYYLVILFAIGLTVLVAWGIDQGWGAFRRPIKEEVINPLASNPAALAEGAADLAVVNVLMALVPPSSAEEVRQLTLKMDAVQFWLRDDSETLDIQDVCLDGIDIILNPDDEANAVYHSFLFEPLCLVPLPEEFTAERSDIGSIELDNFYAIAAEPEEPNPLELTDPDVVSLNFWYPYDSFTLRSEMVVTYSMTLSDGQVIESAIVPYLAWDIQTSGTRAWDVRFVAETLSFTDGRSGNYESMTINLTRSWFYRLTFPFFLIVMVLLIGLVPLLGDRDTLVDICAAMLFGIFGLKGILGPGEQMGQTILDIALVGLYVVLAFAGILFFFNKVILSRRGPGGT